MAAWTSPWSLVNSALEQAAEIGKDMEASLDSAMGVQVVDDAAALPPSAGQTAGRASGAGGVDARRDDGVSVDGHHDEFGNDGGDYDDAPSRGAGEGRSAAESAAAARERRAEAAARRADRAADSKKGVGVARPNTLRTPARGVEVDPFANWDNEDEKAEAKTTSVVARAVGRPASDTPGVDGDASPLGMRFAALFATPPASAVPKDSTVKPSTSEGDKSALIEPRGSPDGADTPATEASSPDRAGEATAARDVSSAPDSAHDAGHVVSDSLSVDAVSTVPADSVARQSPPDGKVSVDADAVGDAHTDATPGSPSGHSNTGEHIDVADAGVPAILRPSDSNVEAQSQGPAIVEARSSPIREQVAVPAFDPVAANDETDVAGSSSAGESSPIVDDMAELEAPANSANAAVLAQGSLRAVQQRDPDADRRDAEREERLRQREAQIESMAAQIGQLLQDSSDSADRLARSEALYSESEARAGALQAEVDRLKVSLSSSGKSADLVQRLQQQLADKEAENEALMSEGTKLAQKQSEMETRIKDLKDQLQDAEDDVADREDELSAAESRMEGLKQRHEELSAQTAEAQRQATEATGQLAGLSTDLQKERALTTKLRIEVDSLKTRLEEANDELTELRDIADTASDQIASAKKAQIAAEERVRLAESSETSTTRKRAAAATEMAELRSSLAQLEAEAGRREDELRQQLSDVTAKWRHAEDRLGEVELGGSSSGDTEALMEQIASLQAEVSSRRDTWEDSSEALHSRITSLEGSLAAESLARKKAERSIGELTQAHHQQQSELVTLRGSRARSDAALSLAAMRADDAESKMKDAEQVAELLRRQLKDTQEAFSAAKRDLVASQRQTSSLEASVSKLRAELEDSRASEHRALEQAEHARKQARERGAATGSRATTSPSHPVSHTTPTANEQSQESILATSLTSATLGSRPVGSVASETSHSRLPTGSSRRGGEVAVLRDSLLEVEASRSALMNELVEARTELAAARMLAGKSSGLESEIAELEEKQELLLELVGAKEEEIESLQSDMEDLKDTYKRQITHLMQQLGK